MGHTCNARTQKLVYKERKENELKTPTSKRLEHTRILYQTNKVLTNKIIKKLRLQSTQQENAGRLRNQHNYHVIESIRKEHIMLKHGKSENKWSE